MDWAILIGAGVLEAVWATALGASRGLRRPLPTIVFVVAAVLSMWGLAVAMQTIPTGTAYAVWTATGASLTVLWAMLRGTEPATLVRVLLLLGIVACVVGLKAVA
ncbi:DMT family transporter [Ornithinimicrobium pratense]|uniref:Multidrug efflux SMR transporter n=1 Tax=Ornithinimicrobium pratense TaxID=2593973 RepID=A0A5J6V8W6_9MICO|nr:multidrug efflux SMR transporter [Ornithinimicrobium pratense]QFG69814.1 multidrug efflux SMR transporter [Ornithinimicrobium pratense]